MQIVAKIPDTFVCECTITGKPNSDHFSRDIVCTHCDLRLCFTLTRKLKASPHGATWGQPSPPKRTNQNTNPEPRPESAIALQKHVVDNQKRVKCDASQRGTPCTRCLERQEPDCRLIQSRRGTYVRKPRSQSGAVRLGPDGRTLALAAPQPTMPD